MRTSGLCLLILFLLAPALRAKEEPPISAVVKNATYVLVTTYSGDVFNPEVTRDDRQAVQDVQKAIEKWGRYKLVYKQKEADLILVVRTGRSMEVQGSVRSGTSPDRPRGSAQSIGGETGDPQDTLDIYMASQGIDSSPLWRGRAAHGLNPPEMQLVKEFRSKVEADARKP